MYGQPFEDEIRPTLKVRLPPSLPLFRYVTRLRMKNLPQVQRPRDRCVRQRRTEYKQITGKARAPLPLS